MADTLAPRLAVRRAAMTRDMPDRYVGDAEVYNELKESLGVRSVSFSEQIRQTAAFMAEWPEEALV